MKPEGAIWCFGRVAKDMLAGTDGLSAEPRHQCAILRIRLTADEHDDGEV
jgi:hypothetical protein